MSTRPQHVTDRGSAAWPRLARLRVPLGFGLAVLVFVLARPTWRSIALGTLVALAGESLRLWAAGHLEKSREVTRSGPYRLTRHPLYAGSSVMAAGLAIAARSWIVALVIAAHMALTICAAIRIEEAFLRQRFGTEYDSYVASRAPAMERRFSLARAWRNREYRAVAGLAAAIGLLALKASFGT